MALLSILILYKKRTNSWLSRTGLQLPVGETKRGSIRKITYSDGKVKIQNPMAVDNGNKVTLITNYPQTDKNGKDSFVIVGISKDQQMDNDTVNLIKSVYPLDDMRERIIDYIETDRLLILDKKGAEKVFATIGITPSELSNFLDSDNSIPQSTEKSKPSAQKNSDSDIYDDPNARHSKDDAIYDRVC